jgi:TetR/AcrR family transcriptional regulator, mexJK operon transcriptional repressor
MKKSPRQGGRPSREAAARLGDLILDTATQSFLEIGYGETTIEQIAKRAGISKRTFYHRYPDKAALFGAVVHRIVDRLRPPDVSYLFEGDDLEAVLTRLARIILRAALNPQALALHRVILSEAGRFPELAAVVAERSAGREAVERIATLLLGITGAKERSMPAARFAATQFLQLVIALPQRRALGLGPPMKQSELDRWASDSTRLLLGGWRGLVSRA